MKKKSYFCKTFQAIHNKDYSVVKTTKRAGDKIPRRLYKIEKSKEERLTIVTPNPLPTGLRLFSLFRTLPIPRKSTLT